MPIEYPCCGSHFWINIAIIFFLVIFAGIMSGLTLGLMSLSNVDLEVLEKSGTPEDRKHAKKLLSVVKKQHLLLCTLLICNAAAMEALPIFLNALVVPWVAILISVTLILLFDEIVPQSICSRYSLLIGAAAAPYVRVLIWICFPVAYPISKVLDYTLGESRHVALFRRSELKTLVDFHGNEAGKGGELTHDETTIIGGALGLTGKTASDAMTPIGKTFAIDVDAKLDRDMMKLILEKGHSRIPVYYEKPTNIIGLVLVKNLLTIHSEDEVTVRNVTTRRIPRVPDCLPLYDILNEFQKGHSHMAAVTRHRDHGCFLSNGEVKIDIEGAQEKRLKLLQKWKSFSNMNSPKGASSASKKGAREMDANVLQIGGRPLEKINEEEEVVGIITMEDVIEELLQEEIFDETDHHYHNSRSTGKVNITVQ